VARLQLIDATFNVLLKARLAQIALRDGERIELVAIDAMRSTPGIWTFIGEVQGTVRAQFANEV